MQDSTFQKSSGDALSDEGAARLEDFSVLQPLQLFSRVTAMHPSPFAALSTEPTVASMNEPAVSSMNEPAVPSMNESFNSSAQPFAIYGAVERLNLGTPLVADPSLGDEEAQLTLRFAFQICGDRSSLSLPELQASHLRRQLDELWQSTCFEVFIGAAGELPYLEFNFAPSGDFAIYAFERYREGMMTIVPLVAPLLAVEHSSDRYTFSGTVRLRLSSERIHKIGRAPALEASLTAVVKSREENAVPNYWAIRHAGERADFHLRESFLIKLN